MDLEKTYFKLFACCKIVKGKSRTAICDLQRNEIHFAPNSLYEIIKDELSLPIADIFKKYNKDDQEVLQEYFKFLEQNELGFYTEEPDMFPEISNRWDSPYTITNSIIDINQSSSHNFLDIFSQLHNLNCQAIQLRFFNEINVKELQTTLSFTKDKCFKGIELYLNSCTDLCKDDKLATFLENHPIISHLYIFNAPKEKFLRNASGVFLNFSKENLKLENCGKISPDYFTLSIEFYTEALHFNTCLNRKVSVDWNGNIKNCPSMKRNYGNISNVKLKEIVSREDFRAYWTINKDSIEICNDCEFRYVCSDCRAYLSEPTNLNSKPAKCSYNPETAEW